eukprot:7315748-Alexandrium_andersonii.AAC.1
MGISGVRRFRAVQSWLFGPFGVLGPRRPSGWMLGPELTLTRGLLATAHLLPHLRIFRTRSGPRGRSL